MTFISTAALLIGLAGGADTADQAGWLAGDHHNNNPFRAAEAA